MSYIEKMFGLEGKTVAITGGGGVIAGAMSEALLNAGAKVALWDIKKEFSDAAVERLNQSTGAGDRLLSVESNAMEKASTKEAVEETVKGLGSLDILINAAGGNRGKSSFNDADIEQFEFVLKLNLVAGLMVPTQVVTQYWIDNKLQGAVINLASMSSYIPLSGVWAYDAAKAAVQNLTMAAAKEFASHGIRVNAIAPGFFIGKQNRALLMDEETGNLTPRGQDVINHTPYGRFGEVAELAGATLLLASSEAAGFITGITIPVDGGYLIQNI
ncbi:MAG: SDR family oxidoreductase [Spirochaetales bacterium]|jgi:NAD(P)-dependent dehydrogenase (short-subunit alcohol dehydrogenase family)|nr:SDR family oxidoreductase [Spirochaetales bacterium]